MPTTTHTNTTDTIVTLEPSQAPEGTFFDSGTPSRDPENQYFAGWYNDMTPWGYRNQESLLRVALDPVLGARVLEWKQMAVRYLLTTDPFWADVRVAARLRVTTPECTQYHDIPDCTESRLGIVLRYVDHRHFYFFAIEGLRRLVLYRRDNDEWTVLAETAAQLHPDQYYTLAVEAVGHGLRCTCGDTRLTATDHRYPTGRVGLRGNTLGKIASAQVQMTPGQKRYNQTLRRNWDREVAAERDRYPRLQLEAELDLRDFGARTVEFVNLRNTQYPDMLLTRPEGDGVQTLAVDLDLNLLWERPGPLAPSKYTVLRDMPDGGRELVTVSGDRFVRTDLATGLTVDECPFPRPVRHRLWVLASGLADRPGNVRGTDRPGDTLWSMEDDDIINRAGAGRNRWGSIGIVNFINGRGTWEGSMHPDPIGHPGGPVNWTGDGQELVFIGSYRGFGLYDGHGRKVVELPSEWCNEANYRRRPTVLLADLCGDPRQEIALFDRGILSIYTQDAPPPDPARVYDPIHRGILSLPGWTG